MKGCKKMAVKDREKVSIITPLYKGESYINGLIEMAVNNSHYVPIQFILVNDSPQNGLIDEKQIRQAYECKGLSDEAFTLTVINHEKNSGIHAARISGLKKAEGEYVLFLDQDDKITDNAVECLLKEIKRTKADVLVGNGYRCFMTESGSCEKKVKIYSKAAILKEVNREKMYIFGTDMIFSPGQCLIRREAIPKVWQKKMLAVNGCDDFLLWLLMFHENKRFYAVMDMLYVHNDTAKSYSASYEAMERSFYAMCDYLDEINEYDKEKTEVLRRRYKLKTQIKKKNSNGLLKTVAAAAKNADIIFYTFIYKLKGYY